MKKNTGKIYALTLAIAAFGSFSLFGMDAEVKMLRAEEIGKRGQALQAEQKQQAESEVPVRGFGLEVKAEAAEVKAGAETKVNADQVKALRLLCADAITAEISPDDLLKFYQLGIRLNEQGVIAAVVKALPDALVRVAQQDGMQAVQKFLDEVALVGGPEEEKNWKDILIQQYPWMHYCRGTFKATKLFNMPEYLNSKNAPQGWQRKNGSLFWHGNERESLLLASHNNIYFPYGNDNIPLTHPDDFHMIRTVAMHPEGNDIAVVTGVGGFRWCLFLWHKNQNWQRIEIDPNHQFHQDGELIISAYWIDKQTLVTLSGRNNIWASHHWRLINNTLVHDHATAVPNLELSEAVLHAYPQISWCPRGVSFIARCRRGIGPEAHWTNEVYEYRDGVWHVAASLNCHGLVKWNAAGTALYTLGQYVMYVWRRNEGGEWQRVEQPLHGVSTRGDGMLSPDDLILMVDEGYHSRRPAFLRYHDNAWRKISVKIDDLGCEMYKMYKGAEFLWNKQGNQLIAWGRLADLTLLNFDQVQPFSLKDFLLCLVTEKFNETEAGEVVLKRAEQERVAAAAYSLQAQRALRPEPKWYTRAGMNKKINDASRFMRRHPKTTIALCVAGAAVAYYARKHKWAGRAVKNLKYMLPKRLMGAAGKPAV